MIHFCSDEGVALLTFAGALRLAWWRVRMFFTRGGRQ